MLVTMLEDPKILDKAESVWQWQRHKTIYHKDNYSKKAHISNLGDYRILDKVESVWLWQA